MCVFVQLCGHSRAARQLARQLGVRAHRYARPASSLHLPRHPQPGDLHFYYSLRITCFALSNWFILVYVCSTGND